MNWSAFVQKFLKHLITALPAALVPVLMEADGLSSVDWDRAGLALFIGLLGSGALGAGINSAQGKTKKIASVGILFLLAGCGASYHIARTAPDGTQVTASAWVAEKQGSMSFTFDGDPAGNMAITLDKQNTEPVTLNPEVLRALTNGGAIR